MYLHLGQAVVIPYRDVIGLFDLDHSSASHLTRSFLERAEREGAVINVSEDLPKSFVLCGRSRAAPDQKKKETNTIFLSQLSTATLLRRAESGSFE